MSKPAAWITQKGQRLEHSFAAVPQYLWDMVIAGEITMPQLRVAAIIARYTREQDDGEIYTRTTNARIGRDIGVDRGSVQRAANELVQMGVVIDLDTGTRGSLHRRYLAATSPKAGPSDSAGAATSSPSDSAGAASSDAEWQRRRCKGDSAGAVRVTAQALPSSSNRQVLIETSLIQTPPPSPQDHPSAETGGGGGEPDSSSRDWEEAEEALRGFGVINRAQVIRAAKANGWDALMIFDLIEAEGMKPQFVLHRVESNTPPSPGPTRERREQEAQQAEDMAKAEEYAKGYAEDADRRIRDIEQKLDDLVAQVIRGGIPERWASQYMAALWRAGRIKLEDESIDIARIVETVKGFHARKPDERNRSLAALRDEHEQQVMASVAKEVQRQHDDEFPTQYTGLGIERHPAIKFLTEAAQQAEQRVLACASQWYERRKPEAVPA